MRRNWSRCALFGCLTVLALWPVSAPAATDQEVGDAVDAAAAWLRAQQKPTGSLGDNGGLDPAWAFLGLAAAGAHPADLRTAPGLPSAQDHHLGVWTGPDDGAWASLGAPQAVDYERVILLARAAGLDPARLSAEQNLPAKLAAYYRDGYFTSKSSLFNHTFFGLIALSQLPVPGWLVERSAAIVAANQHADGGYTSYPVTSEELRNAPGDVDSTGAAIAALCEAGRTAADPAVAGGVAFLRAKRAASGAIGNVNGTSWALDGMGACGIRRGSPGWSAEDEKTVEWLLGLQLDSGEGAGSWSGNAYLTQDALRALAAADFAVPPPPRANPADPVWRPPPEVADGTQVPVVLAIDAGFGDVRFCSTEAPAAAALPAVLAAAVTSSAPAGCVAGVDLAPDGSLHGIDGAVSGAGGWMLSLDDGIEQAAAQQPVGFGEVVGLRLFDPHPLRLSPASLDFGEGDVGSPSEPETVVVTNRSGAAAEMLQLRLSGAAASDFAVLSDDCAGLTLAPGSSCSATLRFVPGARGRSEATLEVETGGDGTATVLLAGKGAGPTSGPGDEPNPPEEGDVPPAEPAPPTGSTLPVSPASKGRAKQARRCRTARRPAQRTRRACRKRKSQPALQPPTQRSVTR